MPTDLGSEPSVTKQEFKDDCDINKILNKFQRTGALEHYSRYSPSYGDYTATDYQTSLNLIKTAQTMYDALPSSIRDLYPTPEAFLNFVQDPSNSSKMDELGLTHTTPPAIRPPSSTGQGDAPSVPPSANG